jgi:APA family basic amino acid/polyamine antiporter
MLGIITCALMMVALPTDTWLRLLVWLALGLVIYYAYGRKRSKLARSASSTHLAPKGDGPLKV